MRSSLVFLFSALLISSAVAAKLGKREAELQNPKEAGTTSDPCDCACACPSNDCVLACPPKSDHQPLAEAIPAQSGPEIAPPAQQPPEQAEDGEANLGFLLN